MNRGATREKTHLSRVFSDDGQRRSEERRSEERRSEERRSEERRSEELFFSEKNYSAVIDAVRVAAM